MRITVEFNKNLELYGEIMNNVIISFLLNEWLWSITWALYHAPMAFIIMFVLFVFWEGFSCVFSMSLSLVAHLLSFGIVAGGIGLFVFWATAGIPGDILSSHSINAWWSSLYLGIMYAIIQSIFFIFVSRIYSLHLYRMIIVAFASNLATSVLIYKLLPVF